MKTTFCDETYWSRGALLQMVTRYEECAVIFLDLYYRLFL